MPPRIQFTEADIKDICHRYGEKKEGATGIAKVYGCSYSAVNRILEHNGIKLRSSSEARHRFPETLEPEVCRRYLAQEESSIQLAEIYGCSPNTIARILRRNGIELRVFSRVRFTEADIKDICHRYVELEESAPQIAKGHGCHDNAIYNILKANGIKTRSQGKTHRRIPESQHAEICRRYLKQGESTHRLAEVYGCSDKSISRILKHNGVKMRSSSEAKGSPVESLHPEICRRYQEGESAHQLAKAYGCSDMAISRILKHNGIKVRSSVEAKGVIPASLHPEICRRYLEREGNTYQLAEAYRCSCSTIKSILRRNGVQMRGANKAQSDIAESQHAEMCRRYVAGESAHQLAKVYGCSAPTVRSIVRRNGVKLRSLSEASRNRYRSTAHIRAALLLLQAEGVEAANLNPVQLQIILNQACRSDELTAEEQRIFDGISDGDIAPRDLWHHLGGDDTTSDEPAPVEATAPATPTAAPAARPGATQQAPAGAMEPPSIEQLIGGMTPGPGADDGLKVLTAAAALGCDAEALAALKASTFQVFWNRAYAGHHAAVLADCAAYSDDQPWNQALAQEFISTYRAAQQLPIPAGYRFRPTTAAPITPPTLMQRHAASQALVRRRLLLLSDMGTGKTLAAQLAVMAADRRRILVVALGDTVQQWADTFRSAWDGITVHTGKRPPAPSPQPVVWVMAVHTFSDLSDQQIAAIAAGFDPDAVVVDEVHSVKQRHATQQSARRQQLEKLLCLAGEAHPDLMVLGLSGTAVINNLQEARRLLELVTGEDRSDLSIEPTATAAVAMHCALMANGIRQVEGANRPVVTTYPAVDATPYLGDLREALAGVAPSARWLAAEKALLPAKLPAIVAAIDGPTVVFTLLEDGFVLPIFRALTAAGYRVGVFSGKDKHPTHGHRNAVEAFKAGAIDVLLATTGTGGTGIDGLQHRSHRAVFASLPWTHAAFSQAGARVDRTGQEHPVALVIPRTYCTIPGPDGPVEWSFDQWRLDVLARKRRLTSAVMDGLLPKVDTELTPAAAGRWLGKWLARLEAAGAHIPARRPIVVPLVFTGAQEELVARRSFGDMAACHSRWNNAASATTHQRLQGDPTEWELYHTDLIAGRRGWQLDPLEETISHCASSSGLVIGDFGCGTAGLADALRGRHTVHSFDHIAISDAVVACDIGAGVPLPDGALDLAVFSLSLMGTNWRDYLVEAWRCLKPTGQLLVWMPGDWAAAHGLDGAIERAGFKAITSDTRWKWQRIWAVRVPAAALTTA